MSKKRNLSEVEDINLRSSAEIRIAIVTSSWNPEVTDALRNGAYEYLTTHRILPENIIMESVPGSYELPLGAQIMLERGDIDGVVCLGCIIQGETRHFEFIAHAVAVGVMDVNLKFGAPVSFGVLTTNNEQQALERAGGKHGNKGVEAAAAILAMLKLKDSMLSI
jgi:6,7-dimethyl-8-ribityllumazine synthase